eukprot:1161231-Pelagomonas_calceolata.AAC.3
MHTRAHTHTHTHTHKHTHLHNLHGHGQLGAPQTGHHLGVVHDAHKLVRGQLHHLLAQQGTPAPLHHIQVVVHLVSAVDGNVELGLLVQSGQRDAQGLSLLQRADGGGHTDDVFQLPLLHELPDAVHGEGSGGAGAQAHHHVRLDVLHGLVRSLYVCQVEKKSRLQGHGDSPG